MKRLKRQGPGAKLTVREGKYETVTYINRGDKMTAQITV